jgi:hypothetical protein
MHGHPPVNSGGTGDTGRDQPRPPLPEIGWYAITDIKVDWSYQHRSYRWAVDALLKDYRPELAGFILINIRDTGGV